MSPAKSSANVDPRVDGCRELSTTSQLGSSCHLCKMNGSLPPDDHSKANESVRGSPDGLRSDFPSVEKVFLVVRFAQTMIRGHWRTHDSARAPKLCGINRGAW